MLHGVCAGTQALDSKGVVACLVLYMLYVTALTCMDRNFEKRRLDRSMVAARTRLEKGVKSFFYYKLGNFR